LAEVVRRQKHRGCMLFVHSCSLSGLTKSRAEKGDVEGCSGRLVRPFFH
jgi:hypothetical protein